MRYTLRTAALLGAAVFSCAAQSRRMDLSGTWKFDGGKIFLPGTTDQAGYGKKTEGPEKGWLSRPATIAGKVTYEREVAIPEAWRGMRVELFLERVHWRSAVWVDGRPQGDQESLSTPHVYDLGGAMTPGRHTIRLEVDNSYLIDVGKDAHSVGEHTQTNWNGVVGRVELRATDAVWIEDVRVTPDLRAKSARVEVTIRNATGGRVDAVVSAGGVTGTAAGMEGDGKVTLNVPAGTAAKAWDEYEGNVERLEVKVAAGRFTDSRTVAYGLREIGTKGTRFVVNGRPVNLRGTLECNIFPLTGYPAMDEDSWARLYRIAKAHGLNSFRFHSHCPPEAAFAAADRAGFLLYVELPVWSGKVGKDEPLSAFMRREGFRILKAYGNHPSFIALGLGNELRGDFQFMDRLVNEFKQADPRRLYTFSADYVRLVPGEASDFYIAQKTKAGYFRVHGSRWEKSAAGTDYDYGRLIEGIGVPTVAHELGQWVTYPDFREIGKYTGVLKARNLEAFRERLESQGMGDQAEAFQRASGRFAWKLYKEDIEACLRTPGLGGFQLLQLQDFPGQGEALIGLLDSFWDSKGFLSAEQMRRFAGATVPLARFEKFVWTNDEMFTAKALVSHYGRGMLSGAVRWTLKDDAGATVAQGRWAAVKSEAGTVTPLGEVKAPLAQVKRASRLRLTVEAAGFANDWDIWVYPKRLETAPAEGVLVTRSAAEARQRLAEGGSVVLAARGGKMQEIRFLPVFWSLTWFPKQPGTMGVLCDPGHPALAGFPNDGHSDFQWYELTQGARAFVLDGMPAGLRPVVQVIDDYHRNTRLGAVVEARVGKGRLLAVALDVETELDRRPVARQLRDSLLRYAVSADFQPRVEITGAQLAELIGQ
ncbi:MAG: glycoside hydrolase family 2 [Candidatus Solibacter usitatus]|nr:glycoside hydrolase family 2 [Candidatus Solibacter usitatus]